jgi:hypothetical protein
MTPAEFRRRHAALAASNEIYLRKALLSSRVAVLVDAMAAFGLSVLEREWSLLSPRRAVRTLDARRLRRRSS